MPSKIVSKTTQSNIPNGISKMLHPSLVASSESELIMPILDGSGSMNEVCTFDGRKKVDHLLEIITESLVRLSNSPKKPVFRICVIYFASKPTVTLIDNTPYYPLDTLLRVGVENPVKVAGGNGTSIAKALYSAAEVIKDFVNNPGIPGNKKVTAILFTDGNETVKKDGSVKQAANNLRSLPVCPTLACVSLGADADDALLLDIASEASNRQIGHFDLAGILDLLPANPYKLFLKGTASGVITKNLAEAIRHFFNILSQTKA